LQPNFLFDTEFSANSHEVTLKKRKISFGGGGLIIAQEASAP
jgi:hypothetical protein